jgi:hypothetical protein
MSLDGLLEDFAGNSEALNHIEEMKNQLKTYFETHYHHDSPPSVLLPSRVAVSESGSPQKVDFTFCYQRAAHVVDELAEYRVKTLQPATP